MEPADVDLVPVVGSAIEMTASSAHERGVELRLQGTEDPAPLSGDPVRLLQVVWNLLSNAIKFTPRGGAIDVRLERDGGNVRLSVIDTGAGIAADFLPHVFELYRQAVPTKEHLPGLGIGLAIVAQIVKLHGGTVCAESAGLGQGSTFTVTLPLRVLPEEETSGRRSGASRRADRRRHRALKPEEPS
jgi:signal transduction histidine kinase